MLNDNDDPICDLCRKPDLLISSKQDGKRMWVCIECLNKQANQQANQQAIPEAIPEAEQKGE